MDAIMTYTSCHLSCAIFAPHAHYTPFRRDRLSRSLLGVSQIRGPLKDRFPFGFVLHTVAKGVRFSDLEKLPFGCLLLRPAHFCRF